MKNIISVVLLIMSMNAMAVEENNKPSLSKTVSTSSVKNTELNEYFSNEDNLNILAAKLTSLNKEKRDTLEILDKVNNFYTASFNSLQNIILTMLTIVGVLIPLLISFYQTKVLKTQRLKLENTIKDEVHNKTEEVKKTLSQENNDRVSALEEKVKEMIERVEEKNKVELKKLRAESLARINHSIGGTHLMRKMYSSCANSYFSAGGHYMDYKDNRNLRIIIRLLLGKVIINLDADNMSKTLDTNFKKFLKKLKSYNYESIYNDDIRQLERKWDEFEKRGEVREEQ